MLPLFLYLGIFPEFLRGVCLGSWEECFKCRRWLTRGTDPSGIIHEPSGLSHPYSRLWSVSPAGVRDSEVWCCVFKKMSLDKFPPKFSLFSVNWRVQLPPRSQSGLDIFDSLLHMFIQSMLTEGLLGAWCCWRAEDTAVNQNLYSRERDEENKHMTNVILDSTSAVKYMRKLDGEWKGIFLNFVLWKIASTCKSRKNSIMNCIYPPPRFYSDQHQTLFYIPTPSPHCADYFRMNPWHLIISLYMFWHESLKERECFLDKVVKKGVSMEVTWEKRGVNEKGLQM